jgi:hypothetical protein
LPQLSFKHICSMESLFSNLYLYYIHEHTNIHLAELLGRDLL